MIWFWIAITLLHKFALSLAVASSTFALVFFLNGIKHGTGDASERRFLGIIYTTLRLALATIIATQLILVSSYLPDGLPMLLQNPIFLMSWVLIAVIIVNAVLMEFHKMPMWLGPVLAGGSWYALFIISVWPGPLPLSFPELLGAYLAFLILFGLIFMLIKRRMAPQITIEPTP